MLLEAFLCRCNTSYTLNLWHCNISILGRTLMQCKPLCGVAHVPQQCQYLRRCKARLFSGVAHMPQQHVNQCLGRCKLRLFPALHTCNISMPEQVQSKALSGIVHMQQQCLGRCKAKALSSVCTHATATCQHLGRCKVRLFMGCTHATCQCLNRCKARFFFQVLYT